MDQSSSRNWRPCAWSPKIVVIDASQVVEQDRHDVLMAKGGLYAEMVARQFQIDEDLDVAVPEIL